MILEYLISDEQKADACVAIIDQTKAASNKKKLNDSYYIVTAFLKSPGTVLLDSFCEWKKSTRTVPGDF